MLVYQVYVHPVGREVKAEDVEVGAWVWEVDGFGYPSRPHRSLPLGPEHRSLPLGPEHRSLPLGP